MHGVAVAVHMTNYITSGSPPNVCIYMYNGHAWVQMHVCLTYNYLNLILISAGRDVL